MKHNQSGNTLIGAMIAAMTLGIIVSIYASGAKQTYQAIKEVDTKNMYSKLYTILSSEMLDQISNFIFGPMQCDKLGDSTAAGQITSVPDFMADASFRPTGEEQNVAGFILSRNETTFKYAPTGGTFEAAGTNTTDPNKLSNLRYRTAFTTCRNNLNETLNPSGLGASTTNFQFCIYFVPEYADPDLHTHLPTFAVATITFWDYNTSNTLTCTNFSTRAQSTNSLDRQSVGAKVKFDLHWVNKSGSIFAYYSGDYLTTVPKGHLVFKTSKTYYPSNSGWRNAGGSVATNLMGLDGADYLCQQHANNIGLDNRFKAFLSDSSNNVRDRLRLKGRISSLTGIQIANSAVELWMATSTSYGGTIVYDETADDYGGADDTRRTWSGSLARGVKASAHCSNWASTSGSVNKGLSRSNGTQVYYSPQNISGTTVNCNTARYLMCVSQD